MLSKKPSHMVPSAEEKARETKALTYKGAAARHAFMNTLSEEEVEKILEKDPSYASRNNLALQITRN